MSDIGPGSATNSLSVEQAVLRRRSVRHFRPEPVAPELVAKLIDLTIRAPSSWNLQPWRIVVVQDDAQRARLAAACFNQPQVREAPVSFVFAISHSGWRDVIDEVVDIATENAAWTEDYVQMFRNVAAVAQEGLGERLREYNTKDALIAATTLSLAAESLGLGSSFMNGYVEEKVKDVIGAGGDDDIGVSLVMAIGYPQQRGLDPGRLPLPRNVFRDTLDTAWI